MRLGGKQILVCGVFAWGWLILDLIQSLLVSLYFYMSIEVAKGYVISPGGLSRQDLIWGETRVYFPPKRKCFSPKHFKASKKFYFNNKKDT